MRIENPKDAMSDFVISHFGLFKAQDHEFIDVSEQKQHTSEAISSLGLLSKFKLFFIKLVNIK
ncbi:hypothetical protein OQZ33_23760 [Pedobacter sp. MC2016-05]|uniref:hypothetical protein n=1 Tax=Pedobacter sp. MC2016-05 TaxID=2994474 RepID=UPI0022458C96|nr:hypothetical protein [Pedobacter sp. MC2016-05]MCX2477372.1 hypothetical protein [Pedobacter sp. MC2016-05]